MEMGLFSSANMMCIRKIFCGKNFATEPPHFHGTGESKRHDQYFPADPAAPKSSGIHHDHLYVGIFLGTFWPVLIKARPDGAPG